MVSDSRNWGSPSTRKRGALESMVTRGMGLRSAAAEFGVAKPGVYIRGTGMSAYGIPLDV
ncbi:hypothetical protein GCM10023322_35770 [Rugosimonospora acidiphila]|uniref:Transposase n=1 Tax=Rugosimonospora acidiphila TaxID=556531 RepID=A0ABP9RUH8_9ACTN